MTKPGVPLVVNGWRLFAHPLFLGQVEDLLTQVETLKAKYPETWKQKNGAKRLAAIVKLVFEDIPDDPARPDYRQGSSLGADRKHWFRAKFYQQHRLFFRYHAAQRIIVFAWVNDDDTKRAYESSDDAYRVFRKMIDTGHPPDDWDSLLKEARGASGRLTKLESST